MTKNETYMLKMRDKLLENIARTRKEFERLKSKGEYAIKEEVNDAGIAYAKAQEAWMGFVGCHNDFELFCDEHGFTEESFLEFIAEN